MSIVDTVKNALGGATAGERPKTSQLMAERLTQAKAALSALHAEHGNLALAVELDQAGAGEAMAAWRQKVAAQEQIVNDRAAAYQVAVQQDALAEQKRRADAHEHDIRSVTQKLALVEKAAVKLTAALENAGIAYYDFLRFGKDARETAERAGLPLPVWLEVGGDGTLGTRLAIASIEVELWRVAAGPMASNGEYPLAFPGARFHESLVTDGRTDLKNHRPAEALSFAEIIKQHIAQAKDIINGRRLADTGPAPIVPAEAFTGATSNVSQDDPPLVGETVPQPTTDHAPDMPNVPPLQAGAITGPEKIQWDMAVIQRMGEGMPAVAAWFEAKYGVVVSGIPRERWPEYVADCQRIVETGALPS